ncbi:hypothetical protein [Streptomyces sp. NPDC048252]|uniref:hypothetical protein n=1 Tax=Streptomyces sp. NPDC048252 TaxID=3154612 RepID=UPI003437526D
MDTDHRPHRGGWGPKHNGDLRRGVDSLTKGKDPDTRQALTVGVQERPLSVGFAPTQGGAAYPGTLTRAWPKPG